MIEGLREILALVFLFGLPVLMMWWMLARMRKVKAAGWAAAKQVVDPPQPLTEAWEEADGSGHFAGRGYEVNDELIRQGARASQSRSHLI